MRQFCFAKDQITESSTASIHPIDIGLIRGYAIFDFFRTVNYIPLFLEDYLDRFVNSAEKTFLSLDYDKEELKNTVLELIDKNNLKYGGIRMLLTGGVSENYFSAAKGSLYIFCEELKMPCAEKYEKGVKLLPAEYVRPMATLKTTNYTYPVWLSKTWAAEEIEDVIYHNQEGMISESSRSNIFIVKDGQVKTPLSNILMGITRKKTMNLLGQVMETDIHLEELLAADEAFITSTTKKILPVSKISNNVIGQGKAGELTLSLIEKFKTLESAYAMQDL